MSTRYRELSRSRWATRGWTYQEQILCKRTIVFLENGYFWDCHQCVWDGIDLFPVQGYGNIPLRAALMGQRLNTRWWPDFSLYLDLTCNYNGREFSYPQDAMRAIQGVLNVLEKSFPGGFVYGLPKLFLDHALLWQPFEIAPRRVDRNDTGAIHSSLPSWSWCGWNCKVDPWSLRSGLSYINDVTCQKQACSWRTRNLVEWRQETEQHAARPIREPLLLDQLVDIGQSKFGALPGGWILQDRSELTAQDSVANPTLAFVYASDISTHFSHPIPVNTDASERSLPSTSPYLSCFTSIASFSPAAVLAKSFTISRVKSALFKISAFEDQVFKDGPLNGLNCPVLVLQQPNGAFAGLLRLMSQKTIEPAAVLDLVAISTGSAAAQDMRSSFEWRIFETGLDAYNNGGRSRRFQYDPAWLDESGKFALLFNIVRAFSVITPTWIEQMQTALATIERRCRAKRSEMMTFLKERYPEKVFLSDYSPEDWREAQIEVLCSRKPDGHRRYREPKSARALWNIVRHHVASGWLAELVRRNPPSGSAIEEDETVCEFYSPRDWWKARNEVLYPRTPDGHHRYREPKSARTLWNIVRHHVSSGLLAELVRRNLPSGSAVEEDETVCEFYNVLWVERKDGIAYRKACGWVPKLVWEAYATGPVEIRLG